jgi:endonuclease G
MRRLFASILILLATLVTPALAAQPSCPQHYVGGVAPEIINPNLAKSARPLCFKVFGVMHSGISRTPLWSAEHLTGDNIRSARGLVRKNSFHPEILLPPNERAELQDYAHSGYDRGHMSPNGDMPDEEAQGQSFSLANMIPQNQDNNRNLWEGIESSVRNLAMKEGELYLVTGPIFEGNSIQRLNGRVMVPTHIFKAVYSPARKQAAAYLVKNADGNWYQVISISELERLAGISIFPALPKAIKDKAMQLPEPKPHSQGKRQRGGHQQNGGKMSATILKMLTR